MKRILQLILAVILCVQLRAQVTKTWLGLTGSSFNTPTNWLPTGAPGNNDNLVFSSLSSVNCNFVVNQRFRNITIGPGYNGIITAASNVTVEGTFSQSSGTFRAPTQNMNVKGDMILNGGTFSHMNGTVTLLSLPGTTNNVSGNFLFNHLVLSPNGSAAGARTVSFTNPSAVVLSLRGGAFPYSYQGTVNVTGQLLVAGTDTSTPLANTGIFAFTGPSAVISSSSTSGQNKLPNLRFSSAGTLTMTGVTSLTGSVTVSQLGGISAGTSTVSFFGAGGNISSGITSTAQARFHNLLINTGAAVTLAGSTQVNVSGDLINNGSISPNTSLVRLNGATTQSVTGSSTLTIFNALESAASGTKFLLHPVSVLDSVKLSAGILSTGGNLTLKSTAALKGRLAQIATGSSVVGEITVETYAAGGVTDWAMLGPSGISGQFVSNWEGQIPMTCTFCPYGPYSVINYFVSIQGWNELAASGSSLAYVELNYNSPLNPGTGYWVYLGSGLGSTSPLTWTVKGAPVTGNVSLPLTNSGSGNGNGYNFISNPYASPISFAKLRNGNTAVDNAIYIYNADLGITTSYVNGVSSPGGTGSANDVIPMGQGFYVRCNAASATLTAQESNKVSYNSANNPLLRTSNVNIIRLRIDAPNLLFDETVIRPEPAATIGFDQEWDALKLFDSPGYAGAPGVWNKRTTISTVSQHKDYSINSLPLPDSSALELPLMTRVIASGEHTISATEVSGLEPGACLVLYDRVTGLNHDLRLNPYKCFISDTTFAPRFTLTVCRSAALTGIKDHLQKSFSIHRQNEDQIVIDALQMAPDQVEIYNLTGQRIPVMSSFNAATKQVTLHLARREELLFIRLRNIAAQQTIRVFH